MKCLTAVSAAAEDAAQSNAEVPHGGGGAGARAALAALDAAAAECCTTNDKMKLVAPRNSPGDVYTRTTVAAQDAAGKFWQQGPAQCMLSALVQQKPCVQLGRCHRRSMNCVCPDAYSAPAAAVLTACLTGRLPAASIAVDSHCCAPLCRSLQQQKEIYWDHSTTRHAIGACAVSLQCALTWTQSQSQCCSHLCVFCRSLMAAASRKVDLLQNMLSALLQQQQLEGQQLQGRPAATVASFATAAGSTDLGGQIQELRSQLTTAQVSSCSRNSLSFRSQYVVISKRVVYYSADCHAACSYLALNDAQPKEGAGRSIMHSATC